MSDLSHIQRFLDAFWYWARKNDYVIHSTGIQSRSVIVQFFVYKWSEDTLELFWNISCRNGLLCDMKGYLLFKYYLMSYQKTVNVLVIDFKSVVVSWVMTEVMVYSVLLSLNLGLWM